MKRIIRLTESDLTRIVRRVMNEQAPENGGVASCFEGVKFNVPSVCRAADGQNMCLEELKKQIMEAPVEIGNAIACVMSKISGTPTTTPPPAPTPTTESYRRRGYRRY